MAQISDFFFFFTHTKTYMGCGKVAGNFSLEHMKEPHNTLSEIHLHHRRRTEN